MFYSQLLLAKKGALGKVWLAAHYDRRLTKAQIANTDIKTLVASVEKPSAALSLRVSAHLLLGLSKIFQRQVMYLFVETNDALVKIRAAFKPGAAAAARRSDIDAPEEGLRGNVDMQLAQHAGGGAGAGALLLAGAGSALPDMEGGAFPDLMGFGAGLEGDGEWSEFFLPGASQGQGSAGGRESASARRGQQRGVALDEEEALPEMAGEELDDAAAEARRGAGRTATRSTATRSSVSDVELLRRGGAGSVDGSVPSRRAGAGGSVDGSEADERSSVFSDREDGRAGRGRRGRSSMMPLEAELATGGAFGVALAAQGGGGLELNEEERDMAALMEGHGGGGDGYDGYDAGGGYVDMGGDYEEGAAAAAAGPAAMDASVDGAPSSAAGKGGPKTPGAMDEGEEEGEGGDAFDPAAGAYATTAQQQAAALAAEEARRKAQREAREAERQSRAAARKEKRERALQASSSAAAASSSSAAGAAASSAAGNGSGGGSGDAQLVLSGEQIKGWLGNTARITRPALDLTSHEAVAAMAARLRAGPAASAGRKARAFAEGAVAGGAFSADAEAAVVSGPGYASLKRDQLDAAPALPGLDGLSLAGPDAAVEAAAAALAQGGEAGKRALPAALAALEGRLLACGGGLGPSGGLLGVGLAPCNPRVAALAAAHAHGRSAYPRPTAEELAEAGAAAAAAAAADGGAGAGARGGSDGEEDAAAAEAAGAAAGAGLDLELEPYGGGGGGEYEDGGYYDAGGRFGEAAEGALDADGQLALDPSPAPSAGSGRSKLDALGRDSLLAAALRQPFGADGGEDGRSSVGAPGSAPRDDADAASVRGAEAGSVVAATPGGAGAGASQGTAGSAPASVGPLAGEFVESGKWHQQTKAMLRILAAEMTGPEVKQPAAAQPLTGRKRKASELEAEAAEGAAKVYDLSDVQTGVGGEGDPISFNALAEGADANQAAVSFLQLLQLKTWDIIGVAQEEAYADVRITRTTRFATALEEVNRGLH